MMWSTRISKKTQKKRVQNEKNHQKTPFFEISGVPDVDRYCKIRQKSFNKIMTPPERISNKNGKKGTKC